MKKKKKWIGIGLLLAAALFCGAVFWFVGRPMLAFVSEPETFRAWVNGHGLWGRLAFVGMVMLQIIVAVIPGEPLEIGAGYAFGVWEGTGLCLLGAVLGSAVIFFFVKAFGMRVVELFFPPEKIQSLNFLKDTRRFNTVTFLLFLIPGTPKDLMSYFVGLTEMKFATWMFISGFARIPSIITSTVGGDALGVQNYFFAVAVFTVTIVVSLTGLWIYNRICQTQSAKPKQLPMNHNSGLAE